MKIKRQSDKSLKKAIIELRFLILFKMGTTGILFLLIPFTFILINPTVALFCTLFCGLKLIELTVCLILFSHNIQMLEMRKLNEKKIISIDTTAFRKIMRSK